MNRVQNKSYEPRILMSFKEKLNMKYVPFRRLNKQIYVILNHRVAYLCWMDALRKGLISRGAFLCHVDYHLDFEYTFDSLNEDARIQDDQETELENFVRDNLNESNAFFIAYAMNRGLIGDGLSIHKDRRTDYNIIEGFYSERTTDRIEFIDKAGCTHHFYLGGSSICKLCGYNSILDDNIKHQDLQGVLRRSVRDRNFVLDIDLDYFTYEDSEGTWAMKESDMDSILKSEAFVKFINNA